MEALHSYEKKKEEKPEGPAEEANTSAAIEAQTPEQKQTRPPIEEENKAVKLAVKQKILGQSSPRKMSEGTLEEREKRTETKKSPLLDEEIDNVLTGLKKASSVKKEAAFYQTPQPKPDHMFKPVLIGVCGGQDSGKSALLKQLTDKFRRKISCVTVMEKMFYRQPTLCGNAKIEDAVEKAGRITRDYNFDNPRSIDWEKLEMCLHTLEMRQPFIAPEFDAELKISKPAHTKLEPAEVIFVEGCFIFYIQKIRELFDLKIYVDADDDVRLSRRIHKNMKYFGKHYTLNDCISVYTSFTKNGYEEFIEPSKKYADVIITNYGFSVEKATFGEPVIKDSAITLICRHIQGSFLALQLH